MMDVAAQLFTLFKDDDLLNAWSYCHPITTAFRSLLRHTMSTKSIVIAETIEYGDIVSNIKYCTLLLMDTVLPMIISID